MGLLIKSEIRALIPLLACSVLFTVCVSIAEGQGPYAAIFAAGYFLGALLYGGLLALIYGAPLYAWLQYIGRASWLSAIVLGGLPGVSLLMYKPSVGLVVLACGVVVACAVHLMATSDWPRNRASSP
jgi:hypothetical protein